MSSECLTEETLQLFADGLLTEGFDAVDKHVSECERCAAVVSELGSVDGEDRFTKAFRDAAAVRGLDAFASGDWIGREREILVIRKIGEGGMAQVWQAYQKDLNRFVAIKVALKDWKSSEAQLQSEAKTSASIHHPNVVSIHDYLRVNQQPAIVMDFVDGASLSQRLRDAHCNDHLLWSWAMQLAEAVEYLHHEKIVHGDLKPSNLLINQRDRLLVADFGISSSPSQSTEHALAGTPGYSAPEKSAGVLGAMNDIYSIGCILSDLARYSAKQSPTSSFSQQLDLLAKECMSKNLDARTTSCADLMKRLKAIQPDSNSTVARSPARPIVQSMATLACGMLMGSLCFTFFPWSLLQPAKSDITAVTSPAFIENDPGRALAKKFFDIFDNHGFIHLEEASSVLRDRHYLTEYPRDKPLVITGFTIEPFTTQQFAQLKEILEQELISLLAMSEGVIDLTDAQFLASLPHLKCLYLTDVRLTEDCILAICKSKSIDALGFNQKEIAAPIIDALLSMKQLGALELEHCTLVDQELLKLAEHTSLRSVETTPNHGWSEKAMRAFESKTGSTIKITK